jgi:hypothetical protein
MFARSSLAFALRFLPIACVLIVAMSPGAAAFAGEPDPPQPDAPVVGPVVDLPFIGTYYVSCGWHGDCNSGSAGSGVDFPLPSGTVVYAAGPGTVAEAGWSNLGYGNQVVLRHPGLGGAIYFTRYAHLALYFVRSSGGPGGGPQTVGAGAPVGYSGNTGCRCGPHLHFQMYAGSYSPPNPIRFTPVFGDRAVGQILYEADLPAPMRCSYPQSAGCDFQPDGRSYSHPSFDGATRLVDNRDPEFVVTNDGKAWNLAPGGFAGGGQGTADFYWTTSSHGAVRSRAIWTPALASGYGYDVYAFIPATHGTLTDARYKFLVNGQVVHATSVNQAVIYNEWVYLGSYAHAGGSFSLRLFDYSAYSLIREVAADAALFVRR